MKPELIEKKVLKKLLKKAYNQTDAEYYKDKTFTHIFKTIKSSWYYVLIIIFIIFIFFQFYIHNKEKKIKEHLQQIEIKRIKKEQAELRIKELQNETLTDNKYMQDFSNSTQYYTKIM